MFLTWKNTDVNDFCDNFLFQFLIAAQRLLGLLMAFYWFLQFKGFELYWGAAFFLRSVHTFSWFLKSNWSNDFGHAETGSGAKKRAVLNNFFRSKFKVEWENGVWTKIRFLASGFLFTCGNLTLIFLQFFRFFGWEFFSKWFPQSIYSPFLI